MYFDIGGGDTPVEVAWETVPLKANFIADVLFSPKVYTDCFDCVIHRCDNFLRVCSAPLFTIGVLVLLAVIVKRVVLG